MDAMTCKCPMCGAPTVERLRWDASARTFETSRGFIIFSQIEAKIFNAFWLRKPVTGIHALADYVYADDPDGGPENVGKVLSITIGRLRAKLNSVGYSITYNNCNQIGWRFFKLGEAA